MAGFLGPERITKWTKNSEARKADMEALMKFSPTDATFESSSRDLEREIEKAENEVSSNGS